MIKSKNSIKDLKFYETDKYYQDLKLKLDSNENPYGPPECIVNAFKTLDIKKFNLYPCYGKTIDALVGKFGYTFDNYLLTNGCDEALNVIINTFLDNNDELLTYLPAFSMPRIYARQTGKTIKNIEFKKKWQYSSDDVLSNVDKNTKIIYLTSPNNPTGNVIEITDLTAILDKCSDKLVVLDCTYVNYSDISENEYYKLVSKYKNLIIVKSFSKDFAIAGLRLGFILADKELINEIRKIISPYSVNSLAAYAGEVILNNYDSLVYVRKEIIKSREYLYEKISQLGYKVYKSYGNFLLCDFDRHKDFIYQKLANASVSVRQFSDENLKGCLRISVPMLKDADYLLSLLEKKNLLVFDLDGVVFDVSNSYRSAIKKTFLHFAGYECSEKDMQDAKNLGGLSNDWDLTKYLLTDAGFYPSYDDIIEVFQNCFYNPKRKDCVGLIDNEKIVLNSSFFKKLSADFDLAVFTGRPKEEAFYSLNKFGIKKYFSFFVCAEDVPEGKGKPYPDGLNKIKNSCPHNKICFFGDTVDDIKSAKDSNTRVCGIVPPGISNTLSTISCLKNAGADFVLEDANDIINFDIFKEGEKCR